MFVFLMPFPSPYQGTVIDEGQLLVLMNLIVFSLLAGHLFFRYVSNLGHLFEMKGPNKSRILRKYIRALLRGQSGKKDAFYWGRQYYRNFVSSTPPSLGPYYEMELHPSCSEYNVDLLDQQVEYDGELVSSGLFHQGKSPLLIVTKNSPPKGLLESLSHANYQYEWWVAPNEIGPTGQHFLIIEWRDTPIGIGRIVLNFRNQQNIGITTVKNYQKNKKIFDALYGRVEFNFNHEVFSKKVLPFLSHKLIRSA